MKTILVAIDSKYIHTNLAVRLLQANTTYETIIKEFTIKDSLDFILLKILEENPDIIAFSAYIWNIVIIQELSKRLKVVSAAIIIYGGPEVSFDAIAYIQAGNVDYIIQGEGEIAFHELLDALHGNMVLSEVSDLVYTNGQRILSNSIKPIESPSKLKSPYRRPSDWEHLKNKIQYVETSRGCPFHCSYCLASLENSVRYHDIENVKSEMQYLMEHGARVFKFLDRTFNINPVYAKEMFDFILKNHQQGMSFQFEITGDLLKKELIEYLNEFAPKNLFRFEIGIQSTSNETNLAVDRIQDNRVLFENIQLIRSGGKIDLHLDLIAGLPYESLSIFENTFNQVFSVYAKELQLGFLKMLRGTKIRNEASRYQYQYMDSPPYEMTENHVLSKTDVLYIHQVESMLEIYWNKGFMNQTMEWLTKQMTSPFSFFNDLYLYLKKQGFDEHRYQLPAIFQGLDEYVHFTYPTIYDEFTSLLKKEYLLYHPIKPKIWWNRLMTDRNTLIESIHTQYPEHSIDDYYKYGVIIPYMERYLMVMYIPNKKREYLFTK